MLRRGAAIALAAVALGACAGTGEQPAATATTAPAAGSGDGGTVKRFAPPSGEVVLTVSGAIRSHNKGSNLALDLATLERMGTVRLETTEPFLKKKVTFEGVPLWDLLQSAGVTDPAGKVHLTALDDYKVAFTLDQVRSSQMLLATRSDGQHMPIDKAGPTRIVFPEASTLGRNPDLWIWSVSTMRVS